eukprot:2910815-Rhodomonas_salina.1
MLWSDRHARRGGSSSTHTEPTYPVFSTLAEPETDGDDKGVISDGGVVSNGGVISNWGVISDGGGV